MNNPTKKITKPYRSNIIWSANIAAVMLVIFAYVYYYEPLSERFSPYWNDKVLDILTLIPAVAAAWLGTLIVRQFEYNEPPFRIWLMFTIGWWCWVGGELSGFAYDIWYPDVYPDFTFIDICWLMGYFFFGLALYYQFRLIYNAKKGRQSALYLAYIGLGLAITSGLTQLAIYEGLGEGFSWWIVYLSVLYPVFDLVEGGAALWLSFLFRRGVLGRAWWGLIAFAIADSFNIFFWLGGDKWLSDQAYINLDTFSNVVYVLGYMLTAIAFLAAYNLIRYGPGERKTKPTGNTIQTT
jgi:hypothetical protein